ncbi:MAG TPA: YlmC/YmxH family sporulation protein [Ruminiclostridium sp.]|nr:YlmC/YmxH family sporulation protein [Ruminiclostridium sp.]
MCRIDELSRKDVINLKDGCKLGNICDIEIDAEDGRVISLIIYGRAKFFGLFGREDDIIIPWCNIETIGEDTILVSVDLQYRRRGKARGAFGNFFK